MCEFGATVPEYLETTPLPRETDPKTEKSETVDANDTFEEFGSGMLVKLKETSMNLKE